MSRASQLVKPLKPLTPSAPVAVSTPPARTGPPQGQGKIHSLAELAERLPPMRTGKTVVHCHGVFDLLHIGHIRHLEEARSMGDLLVVTVTPDRFVNKGPGRPAFGERLRAEALAALNCVDYVAINTASKGDVPIRALRPDLYVKGPDYKDAQRDQTGGISIEREAVESVGGRLVITEDVSFSSSTLINRYLDHLSDDVRRYTAAFAERFTIDDVLGSLEAARAQRVLIVGEAIIDEYQYCEAIGKSSKEPTLAVKQREVERFAGGAVAVANHAAQFCDHVGLLTVLGERKPTGDSVVATDPDRDAAFVRDSLDPRVDATFIRRPDAPTIVKRRYVDSYFFHKLFEVYQIEDSPMVGPARDALCHTLDTTLADYDAVIVLDFGHGMIGREAVTLLCDKSPWLAVNAQSNAGNLGYHTVSKYPRADYVCVAEKEMRLEARDRGGDLRRIIEQVAARLNARHAVVTRGSHGCLCYERDEGFSEAPALADQVRDRMGAGDTFLSVTGPLLAAGAPMPITALVGNAAGAQAVATVGHRTSLDRVGLIRHLECLLK